MSTDDPEAFAEIFDRHHAAVYGFVARRGGREAADEVLSEVFTVAFTRRGSFDPKVASARPWLFGIANNLLRRRWRRLAAEQHLTDRLAESPEAHVLPEPDVAADLDSREAWRRVRDELVSLPTEERDALLLFAWEEMSYAEIAQTVGVPVGTVRSRIHRARKRLQAALAVHVEEDHA